MFSNRGSGLGPFPQPCPEAGRWGQGSEEALRWMRSSPTLLVAAESMGDQREGPALTWVVLERQAGQM